MKLGRALADPFEELVQPGMAAQGLGCVVDAGQLGLGQGGMNLVMADLMQQHRRPALSAAQLGHEMVQALRGIRRDRTVAQGTDRGGFHGR